MGCVHALGEQTDKRQGAMTKQEDIKLAARLRREREKRHWSREYVAQKISVARTSIFRWEREEDPVMPRPDQLNAILNLYGIKAIEEVYATRPSVWMVPYLPNLYFTGRSNLLDELHRELTTARPVAVVGQSRSEPASSEPALYEPALQGMGGVGKTQLALTYAHRYQDEYDIILWARGDSADTLISDFARFAPRLGLRYPDDTPQERLATAAKEFLEAGERRDWLLIVDNAQDLALLKRFLPTTSPQGNGRILVTTRMREIGTALMWLAVQPFDLHESIEFLLRRVSGAPDLEIDDQPTSERQAAEELHTLMEGLPLALNQAAAYVERTGRSLTQYVTLYRERRADFLRQRSAADAHEYPASVATTLLISVERIKKNPAAADLLYLCAFLYPGAIPEELFLSGAAALGPQLQPAASAPSIMESARDILVNYALIQYQPGSKTLSVHRLVQAVIQDQDDLKPEERRAWTERAAQAVNAVYPTVVDQDDWAQCERLLSNALLVAQVTEEQGIETPEVARLLHELGMYLQDRARLSEAESYLRRALAMRRKLPGVAHSQVADTLSALADTHREQNRLEEAEQEFLEALRITQEQPEPDERLMANFLANLANLYHARGQHAEATPRYRQALDIYERLIEQERKGERARTRKERLNYGRLMTNFAATLMESGQTDEAETLLRRAIAALVREAGKDHFDVALALNNLAILLKDRAEYDEAETCYREVQRIFELRLEPGHPNIGLAINNLGEFYKDRGRYAEARPCYTQALEIWRKSLGPTSHLVAIALTNLADVALAERRYDDAERLYQEALDTYKQSGVGETHHLTAFTINGLANVYRQQGKYREAEEWYQRAYDVRAAVWPNPENPGKPNHPDIAETLHDWAQLWELEGKYNKALDCYERALAIREASPSLGAQHPRTIETRRRLNALLSRMGLDRGA